MPSKELRLILGRRLTPVNELNDNDLELLFEEAQTDELAARTLITAEPDFISYLLEGDVSLLSGGFVSETFSHHDQRALAPLFNESLDEDSAILTSPGRVVHFKRNLYESLYHQSQAQSIESSEVDLTEAENELFLSLLGAFNQKKLSLPGLPEAALKIRQAINSPDVGSAEIIEIVQTDPVLSARLVKVANSPLYGTWREIKTVRDAVRRLGLETTKNLSFSLSVRQLFSARTALIKKTIHELYVESIEIAAIAYVIARDCSDSLDPEQALLSGLIQNLGLIPILKYVDEHPAMIQSAEMLGKSIENLQMPISALIFNEWNFDPDFIEIVEQAKNWQRNTGQAADYCDVVIAARLLYLQEKDELPLPNLRGVPVIEKLKLLEFDEDGHYFMDKAHERIGEMQNLLHTV